MLILKKYAHIFPSASLYSFKHFGQSKNFIIQNLVFSSAIGPWHEHKFSRIIAIITINIYSRCSIALLNGSPLDWHRIEPEFYFFLFLSLTHVLLTGIQVVYVYAAFCIDYHHHSSSREKIKISKFHWITIIIKLEKNVYFVGGAFRYFSIFSTLLADR